MSQFTPSALLAGFLVLSPAIFWYGLVEPFESLKSALTQLAALALVVAAGWRWADLRRLFAGPVGLAVAAGVAVAALSTAFSSCPRLSLLGDTDSHDGLGHVVALAVIFAASRAVGARGDVLSASAVGLAIACGYAAAQMAGLDPLGWDHASDFHTWRRPAGTLGHPSYLAGYAVMALPLLAWRAAEADRGTKIAGGFLAAGACVVVLAALSRGPWLAGVAAAVVMGTLGTGRRKLAWCGGLALAGLVLAVAACLVFGELFAGSLRERLVGLAYSPGRRPVWQAAWRVFLDHPWLGSGLDTFGLAFTHVRTGAYWQVEWGLLPRRAHNDLLQALATQGLAGGLVYVGLAVALARTCWRAWRHRPDQRRLVAALLGAVVAFYVQNVFGFAVAATSALFAAVAGTVAALDDPEAAPSPAPQRSIVVATVLACLIVGATLLQGSNALAAILLVGVAAAVALVASWPVADGASGLPEPLTACAARLGLGLPVVWLIVAPVVASAISRRADGDPTWHAVAVRLAPWHDLFPSRRCEAALRDVEGEPSAEQKSARLAEALHAAEEACRLVPGRASHHVNRGRALLELARTGAAEPAAALAAFDRAIELDPCNSVAFADAARAATALRRADDAERYVRRGLAIDPQLGPLHAELGTARLARAIGLGPISPPLLAQAEETLRSSLAMDWHGDVERYDRARLMLALALLQRGGTVEALVHVEEVRRRRPDWPSAGWMAGVALERGGRRDEALRVYRAVLSHWPDNPQAAAGVARLTN